nr:12406_t:CDS:2 [Entrophospora candida]
MKQSIKDNTISPKNERPSSIRSINLPSSTNSPTECLTPVTPEMGQGLLLEVRHLQRELHEKLEKIKELEADKAELKKTIEALKSQLHISKEAEENILNIVFND